MSTTPIYDLPFEQGIAREFVVSDWADLDGNFYDTSLYAGHLTVRDAIGGNVLIDLTTENGGIQCFARQLIASFTEAQTQSLVPIADPVLGARPLPGSPDSAPQYIAGVYEWRVKPPNDVHYPVIRGDVLITLGVVKDE